MCRLWTSQASLRTINLNLEGSVGRHPHEIAGEDRLFAADRSKKKQSDKENDNLNFRTDRREQPPVNGLGRVVKRDLFVKPELDPRSQETAKMTKVRDFLTCPEEHMERTLGKSNKDFAESVRFLQLDEEPADKLLSGLAKAGLERV